MKPTTQHGNSGFRQGTLFVAIASALNTNVNLRTSATADDQALIKADVSSLYTDAAVNGGNNIINATKARDFELEEDSAGATTATSGTEAKPAVTPSRKSGFDAIIASMNRAGKQVATTALARTGYDVLAGFADRYSAKLGGQIRTAVHMGKADFQVARNGHYTGMGMSAIGA